MATDYDTPRKTDDDLNEDSIEELKSRRNDKSASAVDVDEFEQAEGLELPGADLSNEELAVRVLPKQAGRVHVHELLPGPPPQPAGRGGQERAADLPRLRGLRPVYAVAGVNPFRKGSKGVKGSAAGARSREETAPAARRPDHPLPRSGRPVRRRGGSSRLEQSRERGRGPSRPRLAATQSAAVPGEPGGRVRALARRDRRSHHRPRLPVSLCETWPPCASSSGASSREQLADKLVAGACNAPRPSARASGQRR